MARVLVTGGSGFIGRRLCDQLLAHKYAVHVLTRDRLKTSATLPTDVEVHQGFDDIPEHLTFDAVVNLAGEPLVAGRWNSTRKQSFYDSRIGTTDALYDYFVRSPVPPKVLINGSAIGYYGPHGDEALDEEGAVNNCFSHQLCDAWEFSARRFKDMGCRVCYLRTGVVLGPNGGALERMLGPFKMGLGGRLGDGKQWFSWIHLDDLVDIIRYCLEQRSISGPVNGTAPEPVTNETLTKVLAAQLQRPALLPMPEFAARLLFGEMADELLLTGQRVVPQKMLNAGFTFTYPALPDALKQILAS